MGGVASGQTPPPDLCPLAAVGRTEDVGIVRPCVEGVLCSQDRPHFALSRVPEPVTQGHFEVFPRVPAVLRSIGPLRGRHEHALEGVEGLDRRDDPTVEDLFRVGSVEWDVVDAIQSGVGAD